MKIGRAIVNEAKRRGDAIGKPALIAIDECVLESLIEQIIMEYVPALLRKPDDVEIPDDHQICPECEGQIHKASYHRDVSDVYVECKCGYRRLLATVGPPPKHILEDPEFIKIGQKIVEDLAEREEREEE